MEDRSSPDQMPHGFLTRSQFERDLRKAVRHPKVSLDPTGDLHLFAQKYLKELLAVEEHDLLDIEYLVDHMSDLQTGVIHDILLDDNSPAAIERFDHIYDEIAEFEAHRDERHVPRRSGDESVSGGE